MAAMVSNPSNHQSVTRLFIMFSYFSLSHFFLFLTLLSLLVSVPCCVVYAPKVYDVTKPFDICWGFWLHLLFRMWSWSAPIFLWFYLLTFACLTSVVNVWFKLSAVHVCSNTFAYSWFLSVPKLLYIPVFCDRFNAFACAYFCDCFVAPALWQFLLKKLCICIQPLRVCFMTDTNFLFEQKITADNCNKAYISETWNVLDELNLIKSIKKKQWGKKKSYF